MRLPPVPPTYMHRHHLAAALARVSDPAFDAAELFYASHSQWPLARPSGERRNSSKVSPERIHIAVFDSSFNPPTRAHLAISLTSYPPPTDLSTLSSRATPTAISPPTDDEPYTARLLLLSARNVDKTLKPGDATFVQRVEMMRLQALDMEDKRSPRATAGERGDDPSNGNVAVAALNHPTFVGKSDILLRWLRQRFKTTTSTATPRPEPEVRLTFLIGTDTLMRLFIPKYYTPEPRLGSGMTAHLQKLFTTDGSDIVVAHRGATAQAREEEERFILSHESCVDLVTRGKLRFVRAGEVGAEEREMSSTRVRKALVARDEGEARLLMGTRVAEYVLGEGLYQVP
ncbi:hypothetical protein QFC19_002725 [Naganishia cerealis]|uniref:Uncharacterized protein n=1 Tax=Naganishia cerealis TaxID=610337 RepID=A0ACC2W9E0_9TREE|nr:hypothetical protein QFC19_002725 [Naganishia cerealis]